MPGRIEDYAMVGDLQTAALQLLVGQRPLVIGRQSELRNSSSGYSRCVTTWGCSAKSTIRGRQRWWATSHRR